MAKEDKVVMIAIYMPPSLIDKIDQWAKVQTDLGGVVSRSRAIRMLINRSLQDDEALIAAPKVGGGRV